MTPFFFGGLSLFGQIKSVNRDNYRISISQTYTPMNIDGILDEKSWENAEKTGKFKLVLPVDSGYASSQTYSMVMYDELNLYIGIVCFDPTPGKRPVESLRRDFTFNRNDNCMVFLDTYNDQTNGFVFGVSAAGAQIEGLLYNATLTDYTWNTKWKSSVQSYDDYWVAEFSIPFKSIRFKEGEQEWGINFGRLNLKTSEKSVWAPVPRNMNSSSLQYHGTLKWDRPLNKNGFGITLIPYITGKAIVNNQINGITKWNKNTGFDAKMILSTSLNLDLTINPDYSQVEEDKQVTNLDRFELFFPERRQFFLENTDLFANLGNKSARPFFSRRIGLNVPVAWGARLSGKIGHNWRIGLMDMQTGSKFNTNSSNYAVAVLQRKILTRSNIVGFIINKQIIGEFNDTLLTDYRYNRVAGIEYFHASSNNRWMSKALYHKAFYPKSTSKASMASLNIEYNTRSFNAAFDQTWIGSDYIAEVGYVRRSGYFKTTTGIKYSFYPKQGNILYHGPTVSYEILLNSNYITTDRQTKFNYSINWKNRSLLSFTWYEEFIKLTNPFDPTNSGGIKFETDTKYNWQSTEIRFTSDARKMFFFSASAEYGNYFIGDRMILGGSINYRIQPVGSIPATSSYINITLPDPYNNAKYILIGPELDITFTHKIFFSTFTQYNAQIDNINMNMRFQWRFAPVSDLFIIYTSNTQINDFINKNRGLAIKISYWFN